MMTDHPREPIRRRVIYSGTVQGVGFRYTTRMTATRYQVTGFVRNLPDGTVELVAEGAASELDRFQDALSSVLGDYIESVKMDETSASGAFRSFDISR